MHKKHDEKAVGEHRDEGRIKYPSTGRRLRTGIAKDIDDDPEWIAVATGKPRTYEF